MVKKRTKIFLVIIGGLFVFGVGYIFAQKYQPENSLSENFNFQSKLDSDNDGLFDSQEKELGTNPYLKDSDNDGFDDKAEIDNNHNPNKVESGDLIDQDDDGLIGEDEEKYGTDPNNPDSDFDGYLDGAEIASGNDPKSANLSNIENALAQVPEDKKQDINQKLGLDLTSASSINSLQDILSTEDAQELEQQLDQIIATESNLQLEEIPDSEIKISDQETSQEDVQEYFNQIITVFYSELSFIFDQEEIDRLNAEDNYAEISNQIADSFEKTVSLVSEIEVINNDEIINLHKKIITVSSAIETNYQALIDNNADLNIATNNLKNVLKLNKMFSEEVLNRIVELARQYSIENFTLK